MKNNHLFNIIFIDEPVPYKESLLEQEKLAIARLENRISDTILFLEHHAVITRGVRAKDENLLCSKEVLATKGIMLEDTPRGGDVTYHGPGQLVVYPIIKLSKPKADIRGYINKLEEVAIKTVGKYNIDAFRRTGMTGVWTESGKIAAIGVRVKRWVVFHGMSLNVAPDLSHYDNIVPCGLNGEKVTSLSKLLNTSIEVKQVRSTMADCFAEVFDRKTAIQIK
ncbi:MAG: lipoyl(octanoyl) transferase LipB [Lentisphaerae bacterium]|nr:lipoyl(octanoyl) transferase LipB [Lentisphaerota bacterium]